MNTEEKLNQYVLHSYGRYPMAAVRGEGSRLWDSTGKCYLDFCAGIAPISHSGNGLRLNPCFPGDVLQRD